MPKKKHQQVNPDRLHETQELIPAETDAPAKKPSLFSNFKLINSLQILVLMGFPLGYIIFILKYFWTLPAPSDPLQYVEPSVWHSLYGHFPYIDRVVVALGIQLVEFLSNPPYLAGPYYIAIINTLIVLIAVYWAYRKKGFFAGLFTGILLVSSYSMLAYATYVYADQTMTLFALLAFIFFYSEYSHKIFGPMVMAGGFIALCLFSKASGVAILIPFAISITMGKRWRSITGLIAGFAVGTAGIFLLTFSLFGWASIEYLFTSGIKYLTGIAIGYDQVRYNITLSYIPMLLREYNLFIILPLLIFVGAYKQKITRNLYFAALSFVIVLTLMIAITRFPQAIQNYVYAIPVFSSLGTAIYLAGLLKNKDYQKSAIANFVYGRWKRLILGIILIILTFSMLFWGIKNYNWIIALNSEGVPYYLRMAYTLVPLLMVLLFVLVEYSRNIVSSLLLMLLLTVWAPVYDGAFAFNKATVDNERAGFFYTAGPVLNQVPEKKFSIYVKQWVDKNTTWDRVLWVYSCFFNEKYEQKSYTDPHSREKIKTEIMDNIILIGNEKNLSAAKGTQILTDTPDKVLKAFPKATLVKKIPWQGISLSVMDISMK